MQRWSYRWVRMQNGAKMSGFLKLCHVLMEDGKPILLTDIEMEDFRRAYATAKEHNQIKQYPTGELEVILNTSRKAQQCKRCGGLMYQRESKVGTVCIGCSTLLTTRAGHAKAWEVPRLKE